MPARRTPTELATPKRRPRKANDLPDPLQEDFKKFLRAVWTHLGLPPPTPVQYEIADFLQFGPKRKLIEAFRGVGKSWIASAFVCWLLKKDPQRKILVVSASKSRSDDFSTFTLKLIKDIPYLHELIPSEDQRESKLAFDVGPATPAHAPSVKSVGIYGQLTGSRATDIIGDDVEVAQNALTQDLREKLLRAVGEFEAILTPDDFATITFLGTPQTEESVYNKLREKGYTARIWPARYPKVADLAKYGFGLAPSISEKMEVDPTIAGQPTDPLRFNAQDLMERENSYGRSGFALQFMLDTSLSDALRYPLKTADLMVFDFGTELAPPAIQYGSAPEQRVKELSNLGFAGDGWFRPMYYSSKDWAPFEGRIMSIDPSGRGKDETSYAVGLHLCGTIFIPEVGSPVGLDGKRLKDGYSEASLIYLAKKAKQYKVNTIYIEDNFGDGMFTALFKPILLKYHSCAIEEVKQRTMKEARIIDTLEPAMNQHRLVVSPRVVEDDLKLAQEDQQRSLFYQMTRMCKERGALKHDDRLDALAMLVAAFQAMLSLDTSAEDERRRQRMLDQELEVFYENLVDKSLIQQADTYADRFNIGIR